MMRPSTRQLRAAPQLPLAPAAVPTPPIDGLTRATLVQLLARLLTSACPREPVPEGPDETR